MFLKQNISIIIVFTLGIIVGIGITILTCQLMVWQLQPKAVFSALADKKIVETQLSSNTYLYSINHSATELAELDDATLLNQMAKRTEENGMTQFVMIKVDPKRFCAAVAAHPAENVIVMRPLDDNAPEIFNLSKSSKEKFDFNSPSL